MYEFHREVKLNQGAGGSFSNNISVHYHEGKNITYGSVSHRSTVSVFTWDLKLENITQENWPVRDVNTDRQCMVIQAKFVHPSCRTNPLLVMATNTGAMVYCAKSQKLLAWNPLDIAMSEVLVCNESTLFTKGITWVDNTVLVGSYTGEILVFQCSGENSVNVKKPLMEHREPICDLATCRFDDLTCSADMGGTVIVWGTKCKSAAKKISTEQPINAINVLRKQCIVGTIRGKMLLYATQNGALMAEIDCHCRAITQISVAPESAYILTGGEDGTYRIFKLHTRKPDAYQVEWRHSDSIPDEMLSGCQFTNGRGSGIVFVSYDHGGVLFYRIAKKGRPEDKDEKPPVREVQEEPEAPPPSEA